MHRRGILKSNKGSSLILVAALTVVIIGVTVSLRIMAGIIMASANQQLNMDQAYELATSLGNALEERIVNGEESAGSAETDNPEETAEPAKSLLDLQSLLGAGTSVTLMEPMSGFAGLPDASVAAELTKDTAGRYVVKVTSRVGKASYIWTGIYQGDKDKGYEKCAE